MFSEQGIKPENKIWKYLIGSLFVIASVVLGRMLIMLVIFLTSTQNESQLPEGANESLGYLSPNIILLLMAVGYIITNFILFVVVKYLHKQTWQSVISARPKIDWKRILFAFGVSALLWIAIHALGIYLMPEDQKLNFRLVPFMIYLVVAIIMASISCFAEQYFFRGYLMQGVANLTGNRWSLLLIISVINALLYSLHPEVRFLGFLEMFFTLLPYCLFLGVLALMDEGIELCYGFHTASLLVQQLIFTSDNTSLKTDALYVSIETDTDTVNWLVFVPYLIIFPLFFYVCSRKYKWVGWREKLAGKIQRPVKFSSIN